MTHKVIASRYATGQWRSCWGPGIRRWSGLPSRRLPASRGPGTGASHRPLSAAHFDNLATHRALSLAVDIHVRPPLGHRPTSCVCDGYCDVVVPQVHGRDVAVRRAGDDERRTPSATGARPPRGRPRRAGPARRCDRAPRRPVTWQIGRGLGPDARRMMPATCFLVRRRSVVGGMSCSNGLGYSELGKGGFSGHGIRSLGAT